MIIRRLVLAVLLLAAPVAHAVDDGPYLFDLLKQPAYLAAWKAMLAGESVPCLGRANTPRPSMDPPRRHRQ